MKKAKGGRDRRKNKKKRVRGRETSGERRKVNQPRTYGLPSHLTGSGQYSISQMREQRKIQSSPKGNLTSPNFDVLHLNIVQYVRLEHHF